MTHRGSAQILAVLLAVVIAPALARTQPPAPAQPSSPPVNISVPDPTETTGGLPLTPWTWRVPAPNSDSVQSIAFAPDKPSVYLHEHAGSLDLWSAATWWWPEILGAATALITLLCGLLFHRVRRRVQPVGKPCCRRCSYDLSAHVTVTPHPKRPRRAVFAAPDGAKCPECGLDIARHRPLRGRRRWPRLVPIAILWALVSVPYTSMLALGVPRTGYASTWRDWSSVDAAKWARRHDNAWLIKRIKTGDHVVELDLTKGEVTRTAVTRRTRSPTGIVLTPDGRALFLQGEGTNSLICVSTRTGRRLAEAALPGDACVEPRSPSVIGFSPDGTTAFAQWVNRNTVTSGVSAWRLDDGTVTDRVTTPAYRSQDVGRPAVSGRSFLPISLTEPVRFVSSPSFGQASLMDFHTLLVHEAGRPVAREIQPTQRPAPQLWAAADPDRRRLFLPGAYGHGVIGIDLETGETIASLPTGTLDPAMALAVGTASRAGLAGARTTLLIVLVGRAVLVRDLDNGQWLARLQMPPSFFPFKPSLSADGRWIGVLSQSNTESIVPPRCDLVLWNLGPILDAPPPPPRPRGGQP